MDSRRNIRIGEIEMLTGDDEMRLVPQDMGDVAHDDFPHDQNGAEPEREDHQPPVVADQRLALGLGNGFGIEVVEVLRHA